MLRVRFPNGQCVTYNDAVDFWEREHDMLIVDKQKHWIASVAHSSGAIIESIHPCKIENPLTNLTVDSALQLLCESVTESKSPALLAKLKKKLQDFNAREWRWK